MNKQRQRLLLGSLFGIATLALCFFIITPPASVLKVYSSPADPNLNVRLALYDDQNFTIECSRHQGSSEQGDGSFTDEGDAYALTFTKICKDHSCKTASPKIVRGLVSATQGSAIFIKGKPERVRVNKASPELTICGTPVY